MHEITGKILRHVFRKIQYSIKRDVLKSKKEMKGYADG